MPCLGVCGNRSRSLFPHDRTNGPGRARPLRACSEVGSGAGRLGPASQTRGEIGGLTRSPVPGFRVSSARPRSRHTARAPMTIRPLRPGEAQAAALLAARAFHDDPLFVALHPEAATRDREFAIEHEAYIRRLYLPAGIVEVAEVDGRLGGLALWFPPAALRGLRLREWSCLPALARAVGLRRLPGVLREYAAFDRAFPSSIPFHYLGLLAVAPEAQGRGVGSTLVRTGLARADRDGVACYLETGTEANVGFYRRFGFDVSDRIVLPTAPMHWAMWRPAASEAETPSGDAV